MAQEKDEERKASLEKKVATELLKLAMETDEERKARLKKMVATTQLRIALETEEERRARLEYLSDNPMYCLDWNAHSNTTHDPRIQDYQGLLTNLIERALVYNTHLLITDDLYQCMWCCNSFLSK